MTTFKQSAFVKVDDAEQRNELISWLIAIGNTSYRVDSTDGIIMCQPKKIKPYKDGFLHDCISCGTNIPMFKALAALRDDSDYMQWVIKQDGSGRIYRCSDMKINNDKYRKATPAEIVEHFKNQE